MIEIFGIWDIVLYIAVLIRDTEWLDITFKKKNHAESGLETLKRPGWISADCKAWSQSFRGSYKHSLDVGFASFLFREITLQEKDISVVPMCF